MVALAPRQLNDALEDLLRRVVSTVHPRRVILFGSAARGQATSISDIDLLVILSDGTDSTEAELAIYRNLWGLRFAADVIAVTESQIERHRDNPSLVIHSALREGREVYRADR